MKNIKTINGNPVLQYTTMISAGEEVKAVVAYDRFENRMCTWNLKEMPIKTEELTGNLKKQLVEDIIRLYPLEQVYNRLIDFGLTIS